MISAAYFMSLQLHCVYLYTRVDSHIFLPYVQWFPIVGAETPQRVTRGILRAGEMITGVGNNKILTSMTEEFVFHTFLNAKIPTTRFALPHLN